LKTTTPNAAACAWFGEFEEASRLSKCLPCMSLRADVYRQKAAEAKQSAAQAKNPSMKRAFEEVAAGWLVLAEQMEWMDSQTASPSQKEPNT
jgi:hypothetical protein